MSASIDRVLNALQTASNPLSAKQLEPLCKIQCNTVEKNICYLRKRGIEIVSETVYQDSLHWSVYSMPKKASFNGLKNHDHEPDLAETVRLYDERLVNYPDDFSGLEQMKEQLKQWKDDLKNGKR